MNKTKMIALALLGFACSANAQNALHTVLAINEDIPAGVPLVRTDFGNTTGKIMHIVKVLIIITPESGTYEAAGTVYTETEGVVAGINIPSDNNVCVNGHTINKEEDFGLNYLEVAPGNYIQLVSTSVGGNSRESVFIWYW
jgi:hypothetical protein